MAVKIFGGLFGGTRIPGRGKVTAETLKRELACHVLRKIWQTLVFGTNLSHQLFLSI